LERELKTVQGEIESERVAKKQLELALQQANREAVSARRDAESTLEQQASELA
jgi:hypothetical protein